MGLQQSLALAAIVGIGGFIFWGRTRAGRTALQARFGPPAAPPKPTRAPAARKPGTTKQASKTATKPATGTRRGNRSR